MLQALFVQISLDKGFLWNSLDETKSFLKAGIQIIHVIHWHEYFSPCTPCNLWFHNRFKVCCTFATGVLWAFVALLYMNHFKVTKTNKKKMQTTPFFIPCSTQKNSQKQPQPKFHPSRISRPSESAVWKYVHLKFLPVGTVFAKCKEQRQSKS